MRNKRRFVLIPMYLTIILSVCFLSACASGVKTENASGQESTKAEEEDLTKYAGEWRDEGGAVLDIWLDDTGKLYGEIIIQNSESEVSFWSFTGEPVEGDIVYVDCEKISAVYDLSGDVKEESIYKRGRGSIKFDGDNLLWKDAKEDAGKDLIFSYYGEY